MSAPITGQVALTATATALSPPLVSVAFSIKASSANQQNAYIGDQNVNATTGFILEPGESVNYEARSQTGQPRYQLHLSDFYVYGTSGDTISWLASP